MIEGIRIGNLSIDCKDPEKQCDFYTKLLGWNKGVLFNCPAVINDNGFVILFMECDFEYIPPVWPEQSGKQQKHLHLDLQVDDLPSAVAEAERLGAKKAESQFGGSHFVTMIDPEGHPFCLCAKE